MAIWTAGRALEQAGLSDSSGPGRERIGLAVGISGASQYQTNRFTLARKQVESPGTGVYLAKNVPHFQAEEVARAHQIHGPHLTVSSASAGAAIALGAAMLLLASGKVDAVLVGGAGMLPDHQRRRPGEPGPLDSVPCSPFSGEPGMSFGEGAAYFVLETPERARSRGVAALGELLGCGVTLDGYDPITNDPSGEGMARAMRAALRHAGASPEEIDWIRASGTGNRDQDVAETLAIKQVFPGGHGPPPVSSLEPYFGHANGASPALGLAAAVVALEAGVIPPTLNFAKPRPGCDLDYVPNRPRPAAIRTILAHSAAFGGINAALVAGRADGDRPRPPSRPDTVVVTGLGIVSPIGCGVEAFVAGLRQARTGIGPIDRFDASRCTSRHAGLVRDFQPRRLTPALDLHRSELLGQYAATAASLALQDAGLGRNAIAGERIGVVTALAHGSGVAYERFFDDLCRDKSPPRSAGSS
jgi:3-oxoacyl-[acyl-carrier-protein] synthase II